MRLLPASLLCALLLAAGPAPARPLAARHNLPGAPRALQTASSTLLYFGGPVISNPKVYVLWWGDPANISADLTKPTGGIADFYAAVLDSTYLDAMGQYSTDLQATAGSKLGAAGTGQHLGRGNYAGTFTLSQVPTGTISDGQIQAALEAALAAGTLPPADENSLYAIHFPSSVIIAMDGAQSCGQFGGYHDQTVGRRVPYLALPDCNFSFASFCSVASHELLEAATDRIPTPGSNPDYPQAWNDSGGNEVADLCESRGGTVTTSLGAFHVQSFWDERSHSCQVSSNAAQDFRIALQPNRYSLAVGGSTQLAITTETAAGAAQPLSLSVAAPAGLGATLGATTVTSGSAVALTLTGTGALPMVDAQVVVTATGEGGVVHTASLLVQVVQTANDFSLAVTPGSQTLAAHGSAAFTVSAQLVAGAVPAIQLGTSGLPDHVTATFTPSTIAAGGTSTLTLVNTTGAAGVDPFLVTGTAGVTHTASAEVTVLAPVTDGGADAGPGADGGSDAGTSGSDAGATGATTAGGCGSGSAGGLLALLPALVLLARRRGVRPQKA